MAFNHRKLFEDLGTCESFCDPEKNTDGPCPDVCNRLCSSICNTSLNGIPQSPEISAYIPLDDYDHHPNKAHKLSLSLTIFVSLVATAFLLFCCYTVYKLYTVWNLNRARARRANPDEEERINDHDDLLDEDHGPVVDHPIWHIRTVGLQPSVISAITVCKYKRGDGLVEGTDCSVCLTEFQEDENLRLLPKCSHAFHIPCIDTWLISHTNCPVCRAGIIFNTDGLPSRDQGGGNSAEVEGNQVGDSEEIGREREDEVSEIGMNIEEEGQLDVGNGFKSIQEVQPMRRSVSMDSLAVGNSDGQLVKESKPVSVSKRVAVNQSLLRLVGSSSIGRSLQRGHTSLRRSFSCSGKVLQSRHP